MINITIDDIVFEVWGDKVLWSPPKADGEFREAPEDWVKMARALVLCDYEDRDEFTYVAGNQLHEHFMDTHDDQGNRVPGGRPSGLHFPIKAGMPPMRAKSVITGKLDGKPIVSVLEWDNPLLAVMTAREVEKTFGLAEGTIKKLAREDALKGVRKSEGTWLMLRMAAEARWS